MGVLLSFPFIFPFIFLCPKNGCPFIFILLSLRIQVLFIFFISFISSFYLFPFISLSARTNTGMMVLDVAKSNGQNTAKMLESLYNARINVHAPCTSEGATMLVCAVQNGQWNEDNMTA